MIETLIVDNIPDIVLRTIARISCNADKIRSMANTLEEGRQLDNKILYDMEQTGYALTADIYKLRQIQSDVSRV